LFYIEVPIVPVIVDRTLGSFSPSSSSIFSTAAAALPLVAVATPPEASSCSSAAPRVARELSHHLSASPLSSPARATPLRRCPNRQQMLAVDRRAVLLPSIIAYLNLNQGCCGPSFARPLTLFFFSGHNTAAAVELYCRRSEPPWTARPAPS
jgi:hypothetical protein